MMFLEAQFGPSNLTPILTPKLTPKSLTSNLTPGSPSTIKAEDSEPDDQENDESELEEQQKEELERLHKIGIPVPGVEIKVDKWVAKVWLEDLEIECANRAFSDRVRAVVERAVEVTAPLWA
jgi:cleavage and polyadenylation specificity factor subunit 3